jgi:hypothetical protein
MAAILVVYTVLNILVFGLVVLFARAARTRARPNERVDLEDNSIIDEEWDLIRQEQCLPSGCPRRVGTPPRPRKDVTCEICAALFMERYWQERLSSHPSSAGRRGNRAGRDAGAAPMGLAEPSLVSLDCAVPGEVLMRRRRNRTTFQRAARGRKFYAAGGCCVIAGALVGILSSFLLPGYLLVLTGIALLIAGAVAAKI